MSRLLFFVLVPFVVYGALTVSEWAIHRHVMHSRATSIGRQHIVHHVATDRRSMRLDTTTPDYAIVLPDENLCLDFETVVCAAVLFALLAGGVYWTTRNGWYAAYTMCI